MFCCNHCWDYIHRNYLQLICDSTVERMLWMCSQTAFDLRNLWNHYFVFEFKRNMSTEDKDISQSSGQALSGAAQADEPPITSPSPGDMNLSTLDKIKRFFFSKEEWEAYLLERLEEEKRKKGISDQTFFITTLGSSPQKSWLISPFILCNTFIWNLA